VIGSHITYVKFVRVLNYLSITPLRHTGTAALDRVDQSASRPSRLTPGETAPGIPWIDNWVRELNTTLQFMDLGSILHSANRLYPKHRSALHHLATGTPALRIALHNA
jgi:hypothetical protein